MTFHLQNRLDEIFPYFIAKILKDFPEFKNIEIIYSSKYEPGEGEHKIKDFINHLHEVKEIDEKTTHLIYGNDADQIILGKFLKLKYRNVKQIRKCFNHKKRR